MKGKLTRTTQARSIEFLRLCINFGVTPTFAQVKRTKARERKTASEDYQNDVLDEELRLKLSQLKDLRTELHKAYKDLRERCSTVRFVAILPRTLAALRKNQREEMERGHVNKFSRLLSKKFDVNEHINNTSSYRLSFFEKLVICRGLKFSLPQRVSPISKLVLASFEKAYWKIEPSLEDPAMPKKELASSTLRSIALNYIERTSPNPPKALVKALNRLKKRDDIAITRPDKGPGVVIMDKAE